MIKITKEDFEAYEAVRARFEEIQMQSGLTKEKFIAIIKHYEAIRKKFQNVRKLEGERE